MMNDIEFLIFQQKFAQFDLFDESIQCKSEGKQIFSLPMISSCPINQISSDFMGFLKCKPSKKVSTTFGSKLFLMLQCGEYHHESFGIFGIEWIDKKKLEFKVDQELLRKCLDIKRNSLNHNFKNSEYIERKHQIKDKFSRKTFVVYKFIFTKFQQPSITKGIEGIEKKFRQIPQEDMENVKKELSLIGKILLPKDSNEPKIKLDDFVKLIIHPDFHDFETSKESILKWIQHSEPGKIDFESIVQIEALFGPFDSMIRKIYSFLTAITKLNLEIKNEEDNLNCFVISLPTGQIKFWNNPARRIYEKFIIDERGNEYDSFEIFFESNLAYNHINVHTIEDVFQQFSF
jgi:hypothetical protein